MIAKTLKSALETITPQSLLKHIEILACDRFEGRAPGTEGERLTLDYLTGICGQLGLAPAGDNHTYLQSMDVTGLTAHGKASFSKGASKLELTPMDDIVVRSQWQEPEVKVESDLVFVGYGIVAPEYGWDDYKDVDVRGKTVVMLIGDPSRPDKNNPDKLDEKFFKGKALTYYGRWTYKYEIASKKGAAAVLIVHDTAKAGYGWDVVQASWGGESFGLAPDPMRVKAEGWISDATAKKTFALAGQSFDQLHAAAQKADFKPVALGVTANLTIANTMRHFRSANVIAKIEGSDPALKHECIFYSAHWDHFGKREKDGKTEILSGALDNGSGVSVVLEIAKSLTLLDKPPRRSVYFLFTTLEEYGLLGSQHYVQNPVVPLKDTVAIINFDILNPWGRTKNLVSVAQGHSSLDQVLERTASEQNRTICGDPEPDKGYFFRSDHFEFVRQGVPALFILNPGDDFIDKPAGYGEQRRIEYLCHCYHKAADKVNPDWDLSGMVEDAQLLLKTGLAVANSETRPVWNQDSEFGK